MSEPSCAALEKTCRVAACAAFVEICAMTCDQQRRGDAVFRKHRGRRRDDAGAQAGNLPVTMGPQARQASPKDDWDMVVPCIWG